MSESITSAPRGAIAPDTATPSQTTRDARTALVFEQVVVRRAPSFEGHGFHIDDLGPGINVIHGPNATGKTTVARAIATLVWPATPAPSMARAELVGQLTLGAHPWRVDFDHGRVVYQHDGLPSALGPTDAPPDTRDRYYLGLSDLFQTENHSTFAEFIARESVGGYDVKQAANALNYSVARRASSNLVQAARDELRDAETAQQELLREDDTLHALTQDLQHSRAAEARAELLVRLQEARRAEQRAQSARATLDAFPAALAHVHPDDPERLRALQVRREQARQDAARARQEIDHARAALQQCPLNAPLPPTVLPALQAHLDELERLTHARSAARQRTAEFDQKAAHAWQLIGNVVEPSTLNRVDASTLKQLADLARRADKIYAEFYANKQLRALLGGATHVDTAAADQLRQATQHLRAWLRTPPPLQPDTTPGTVQDAPNRDSGTIRAALLLCAIASAAAGVLGAATVSLAWLGLLLIAVVLVWVFWSLLRAHRDAARAAKDHVAPPDRRSVYREDFEKLGLESPDAWQPDAVERALQALDAQLAALSLRNEKAAQSAQETERLRHAEEKQRQMRAERDQLFDAIGLNLDLHFGADYIPGFGEESAELWWLTAHIQAWQDARIAAHSASAQLDTIDAEIAHTTAQFCALLGHHVAQDTPPADLAAAKGAFRALQQASQAFVTHQQTLANAQQVAQRAAELETQARAECDEILTRLGLGQDDDAEVARLAAQLDAWKAAHLEQTGAQAQATRANERLAEHPDYHAELDDLDPATIAQRLANAQQGAARRDELFAKIERIKTRIDAAKKSRAVEQKRADYLSELTNLTDALAQNERRATGAILADFVREQTRDATRPPVFRRARELFAAITHGRYRLDLDEQDGAEFRAFDTVKQLGHGLDELSSGTRLQLLLAVRVAFVEQQETGARLPLILDETLANSDDPRALAIIEAVEHIARQGRQIFYFTAQHDEVRKWRQIARARNFDCRFIDLGAITRPGAPPAGEGSAALSAAYEFLDDLAQSDFHQTRHDLPEPAGYTHTDYARALGLRGPLNPRLPVTQVHLWYLTDEPGELYALLKANVSYLGALQNLHQYGGLAATGLSEAQFQRIQARARVLEAEFAAWSIGRGKPVGRDDLVTSRAVSDVFIDAVSERCAELYGDAVQLLEAIEKKEFKSFRIEKLEELRQYLESNGFIDHRAPLNDAQRWTQVLSTVAPDVDAGWLDADAITRTLERARFMAET